MDQASVASSSGPKDFKKVGTILIVLGVLAMLAPLLTTELIAALVGALVTLGGIGRLYWAFQSPAGKRDPWRILVGVLTLLCGLFMLANTVFVITFMVIVLSMYLILDGLAEVIAGNRLRPAPGGGMLMFTGIVSIVLGILLWNQMPLTGAWAIGTLVGIKLLFTGFVTRSFGTRMQQLAAA
ncbi:MAG: DUF308 domain-containing protein [Planctomycetota bacterium]